MASSPIAFVLLVHARAVRLVVLLPLPMFLPRWLRRLLRLQGRRFQLELGWRGDGEDGHCRRRRQADACGDVVDLALAIAREQGHVDEGDDKRISEELGLLAHCTRIHAYLFGPAALVRRH